MGESSDGSSSAAQGARVEEDENSRGFFGRLFEVLGGGEANPDGVAGSPSLVSAEAVVNGTVPPEFLQGRTVFVGATYIKSGNTILNEFRFQVPEDTPIIGGEELSIFYRVSEEAIDPWNYVVGTNWDINGRLSLNVEAATGGSRDQIIGGLSWRF